jgi:hypothetical protein
MAIHPDKQKIRINGLFFDNGLHWQFEVEKIAKNDCFIIRIYWSTNKTVIHNSLYESDKWGNKLSHKRTQYKYSEKMFTGKAKPFQKIGDPDKQRPDEWSCAVIWNVFVTLHLQRVAKNCHFVTERTSLYFTTTEQSQCIKILLRQAEIFSKSYPAKGLGGPRGSG